MGSKPNTPNSGGWKNADARLREHGPTELVEFFQRLKERLLDVSFERPLTDAEAVYEDLHKRLMTAEKR